MRTTISPLFLPSKICSCTCGVSDFVVTLLQISAGGLANKLKLLPISVCIRAKCRLRSSQAVSIVAKSSVGWFIRFEYRYIIGRNGRPKMKQRTEYFNLQAKFEIETRALPLRCCGRKKWIQWRPGPNWCLCA